MSRPKSALERAIEEGRFSNLPNDGKPLDLRENPYTPDDRRLAYKMLQDNDMAPEWVLLGKTLEVQREKLINAIKAAIKRHRGMLADAERAPSHQRDAFRRNAQAKWESDKRKLAHKVEAYNRDLGTYNLKAAQGMPRRTYFNLDKEINRLQQN